MPSLGCQAHLVLGCRRLERFLIITKIDDLGSIICLSAPTRCEIAAEEHAMVAPLMIL